LYRIRAEVANFYLRTFFQQPTSLINHQMYYKTLQEVLGIANLLKEVQQATTELEYIISNIHKQKNEALQQEIEIRQNDQHTEHLKHMVEQSKNEMVLTLVVEGAALPYYTYSFLTMHFI